MNCENCEKLRSELVRARDELERVQKQFGVCSICGYVAWKDMDARTEECQYCKLQRQAIAMKEALSPIIRALIASHRTSCLEEERPKCWAEGEKAVALARELGFK